MDVALNVSHWRMNKCCNFLNGREVRGYVQQTSHNLLKTTEKVIFNKPFDEDLTTMAQKNASNGSSKLSGRLHSFIFSMWSTSPEGWNEKSTNNRIDVHHRNTIQLPQCTILMCLNQQSELFVTIDDIWRCTYTCFSMAYSCWSNIKTKRSWPINVLSYQ